MSLLPVRKIVCPVDFSVHAHEGLNAAVELAQKLKAELVVVHVVPLVPVMESSTGIMGVNTAPLNVEEYTKILMDSSREQMDKLLDKEVPRKVKKKGVLRNGHAADEILGSVEEEKADMIVLSTHGHTGLSRLLMGSVAERVIRHAAVPVLVIRIKEDRS